MLLTNGKHTYAEIKSQGEIWQKVLENAEPQIKNISGWLEKKHDEVIFTGCGSTHYLSLSAAKIWTALTRESARGIPSSEAWYYADSTFSKQRPLMVAVSRSGETTETIKAIDYYKKAYGEDVLVVSCYPESSMVKSAGKKLLAADAQEISVAQTRSFSSMFILCQLLAGYAAHNTAYIEELKKLPGVFSNLVKQYEPLIKTIAEDKKYQHFVFLGSGLNYGLASEVMLKMKEMSTSISEVFHFMEFRHGPMSMITERSLVIGLVSDSRKEEELKVLQDMKALGATTMALVDHADGVKADHIIEFGTTISDEARGALYLPVLQLLGYYHSLSKGLDPDQPTNLSAVVYL